MESAVASALHDLHDLHSLPFEEPLRSILDERIRQVDYALAQTFWILHLPPGAMHYAVSEERYQTGEPYRYQEIDILPGAATANAFIATLRDCLAIWAEKASVRASGASTWTISVHGLSTHLLHLYPGLRSFPVSPPDQLPSGRATSRNTMPPRLRTSIEDPKLVIVIDDLGGNPAATRQLLELNYPVTLAFWPHGLHTRDGARTAHARGREILVHQPMEPLGYPKVKPGPGVLLSGMTEEQIRRIVQHSLATVPYASGLNNHMGSRFTQQKKGVAAVIRILKERGLFMLDSLTHSRSVFAAEGKRLGALHYQRNVFLDVTPTRGKILEEFRRAERIALLTGQAIAIGHPLPETLSALKEWEQLRNKHIRLVRLSDLRQD